MASQVLKNLTTHNLDSREEQNVVLPERGQYATGLMFLDVEEEDASKAKFEQIAHSVGLGVLCWREVPTDNSCLGKVAKNSEPVIAQVFLAAQDACEEEEVGYQLKANISIFVATGGQKSFQVAKDCHTQNPKGWSQVLACHEKLPNHTHCPRFYMASLSTRTVVYKGQFDPCQLWDYYTELRRPELETHLCIVHTR